MLKSLSRSLILLAASIVFSTATVQATNTTPAGSDKKELAVMLQNSASFVEAVFQKATDSENPEAVAEASHAQEVSAKAMEAYKGGRYDVAVEKTNEAYRLGLSAAVILKEKSGAAQNAGDKKMKQEAKNKLEESQIYLDEAKISLGYLYLEESHTLIKAAETDRQIGLEHYKAGRYADAIPFLTRSLDQSVLAITKIENIQHEKVQKNLGLDQLIQEAEKDRRNLQAIKVR